MRYERRIVRACICGSFMAQWLWQLQPDTLGSSPAAAGFSLLSFLPEQIEFQRKLYSIYFMYLIVFITILLYINNYCILFVLILLQCSTYVHLVF